MYISHQVGAFCLLALAFLARFLSAQIANMEPCVCVWRMNRRHRPKFPICHTSLRNLQLNFPQFQVNRAKDIVHERGRTVELHRMHIPIHCHGARRLDIRHIEIQLFKQLSLVMVVIEDDVLVVHERIRAVHVHVVHEDECAGGDGFHQAEIAFPV